MVSPNPQQQALRAERCGMLRLEDGINKEAFRVAVIAARPASGGQRGGLADARHSLTKSTAFCDLTASKYRRTCFARDCASRDWRNGEELSPPELAWIVAIEPVWPVLKESSSVSVPRFRGPPRE